MFVKHIIKTLHVSVTIVCPSSGGRLSCLVLLLPSLLVCIVKLFIWYVSVCCLCVCVRAWCTCLWDVWSWTTRQHLAKGHGRCNAFEYEFKIEGDMPPTSNSRSIPFTLRAPVREQIQEIMRDKILEESYSTYFNPLTLDHREPKPVRIGIYMGIGNSFRWWRSKRIRDYVRGWSAYSVIKLMKICWWEHNPCLTTKHPTDKYIRHAHT